MGLRHSRGGMMLRKGLQAQVISYEKHRTKSSQATAKGHGEALARLPLSPNPRTDSTHQAVFQNSYGLRCLPLSISAGETSAVEQNVGCVGGR